MAGRPSGAAITIQDTGEKAWRPCLGPGCNHLMYTTKAVRICARGHAEIAGVEVVYGAEDRGPVVFPKSRRRVAPYGVTAAMVEA
mgnify:CR=1 FL=1